MAPSRVLQCIKKSKAIEFLLYLLKHGKSQSSRIFDFFYPNAGSISCRTKDLWVPCHLIKKSANLVTNRIFYELTPYGREVAELLQPLVASLETIEDRMVQDGVLKQRE